MPSNAVEQPHTISDTVPGRSPPAGRSQTADTVPLLCTRLARPALHRPPPDIFPDRPPKRPPAIASHLNLAS